MNMENEVVIKGVKLSEENRNKLTNRIVDLLVEKEAYIVEGVIRGEDRIYKLYVGGDKYMDIDYNYVNFTPIFFDELKNISIYQEDIIYVVEEIEERRRWFNLFYKEEYKKRQMNININGELFMELVFKKLNTKPENQVPKEVIEKDLKINI